VKPGKSGWELREDAAAILDRSRILRDRSEALCARNGWAKHARPLSLPPLPAREPAEPEPDVRAELEGCERDLAAVVASLDAERERVMAERRRVSRALEALDRPRRAGTRRARVLRFRGAQRPARRGGRK
jgi:hypothetical protein